ncbi:MAG: hypothetical protein L3J29_04770 [Cyclobacteriaceae bacterium]|nr:hypothetical protein [Cyclobacteriaceae bacterium]
MGALFEIKLKSILVKENGKINPKEEGVNAFAITLFLPREGVPSVASVRSLKLMDKETFSLNDNDHLKERFLLKELIKGHAFLEVEVTAVDKLSKLQKTIFKIFRTGFSAVISAIPGIGDIITGLVKMGTDSFFETLDTSVKDKVKIIGKGRLLLNESTTSGDFEIVLETPKQIKIEKWFLDNEGQSYSKKIILPKKYPNGTVVLSIEKIN